MSLLMRRLRVCPALSILHCLRRRLRSFIFVFESANRIVWEPPLQGNATYLFELESPLPIALQVCCSAR